MSEQQQIRDALADIANALKEHRDFGPYYDESELKEIAVQQQQLERRLKLTERETWEPQPQQ